METTKEKGQCFSCPLDPLCVLGILSLSFYIYLLVSFMHWPFDVVPDVGYVARAEAEGENQRY